jgi:molecular chaperone DnaK (HSP70)
MVIGIGDGTTDISVIERTNVGDECVFEVGCVAGDNMLGGVDFDAIVCELIRGRLLSIAGAQGLQLFERKRAFFEERATELKEELNRQKVATMTLPDVEFKPGMLTALRIERKLRLPIIQEFQDDAVVNGLALQAGIMGRSGADRLLLDIMYQGIYIACPEGTQAYRDYDSASFIERSNRIGAWT